MSGQTGAPRAPLVISVFTESMPEFQLVRDGIDKGLFSSAVHEVGEKVARRWRSLAAEANTKDGFKRQYIKSIRVERMGEWRVRVRAEGKFVAFVEEGIKAFDMKPGLLAGARARFNQD